MIAPDILLAGLEDSIVLRRGFTDKIPRAGILLLDAEALPQEQALYLGSWQDIPAGFPEDALLLCSDADAYVGELSEFLPRFRNLILFRMRTPRLYNEISSRYRRYNDWRKELILTKDLQALTQLTSDVCGYPIAVVDAFFQQMAAACPVEPKSEMFRTLIQNKVLPQDVAESMLPTERGSQYADKLTFTFSGVTVVDYLVRYDSKSIARILVEFSNDSDPRLASLYLDDFFNAARPLIHSTDTLKNLSMNAISTLIADLIDLRITDAEEVERRRKLVPDMVKGKVYHPIVIRFQNPGAHIPYTYITGQLERIFRHCSVTSYNDGLLVIAAKKHFNAEIEYDHAQLKTLLETYDATAGIGDCTLFLSSLRPLYIQASAAARLGRTFSRDKTERIFYYRDYRMYFYTDLVIEAAVRQHEFWNISYLCTPGIIAVLRYDKKYEKDLYKTLQVYLECNCNASLCAQKMGVHRNTINYRIDLLEDLLAGKLSDFKFRQTIEFSMLILDYEVQYLHCNPLDTSGKMALDLDWMSFKSFTDRP